MKSMRIVFRAAPLMLVGLFASAQDSPAPAGNAPAVFRSESRLVLIDAVVVDKKGNYLRDLTAKDFRVWQDDQEQEIKTFSFQADPASPARDRKQFIILFFDNTKMSRGDQMVARKAAAQIIASNTGPNRLVAVVNFSGSLQIAQSFTTDVARLNKAITGVKLPIGGGGEDPTLTEAESDFEVRDSVLALRSIAKNLSSVPGRKSLVYLSAGFPIAPSYLPN